MGLHCQRLLLKISLRLLKFKGAQEKNSKPYGVNQVLSVKFLCKG